MCWKCTCTSGAALYKRLELKMGRERGGKHETEFGSSPPGILASHYIMIYNMISYRYNVILISHMYCTMQHIVSTYKYSYNNGVDTSYGTSISVANRDYQYTTVAERQSFTNMPLDLTLLLEWKS